jgi:hypothetical protein
MARMIDLNELVGEDIGFQYGKPVREYFIPGDIDVETVLRLFEMFTNVGKIDGDDPAELAGAVKQRFDEITRELLTVLQIRQPTLKKYPFGIRGTGHVLRIILGELGVNVTETNPPARAKRPQRKSASIKTKTRRR